METTVSKLYSVYTTISEFVFRFREDMIVLVTWLVVDREKPPIPYEVGIKDYNSNIAKESGELTRVYPEEALKQLFTYDEALALNNYIEKRYKDESKIIEAILPLPYDNSALSGFSPIDPYWECYYRIYEEEGYDLPFKVEGYFNLIENEIPKEWAFDSVPNLRSLLFSRQVEK